MLNESLVLYEWIARSRLPLLPQRLPRYLCSWADYEFLAFHLPPTCSALLAETMHSMADVMNQLLLRAGLHLSRRAPTKQHPYGFHKEKYIYALMSAVGIFCLGAGAAVVHGIQSLFDPPQLENMVWSLGGEEAWLVWWGGHVGLDCLAGDEKGERW